MKKIAIIPARYASTRLPGKPLLDIAGKPMLLRVYEQAKKSSMDRVIIATDDVRIMEQMQELACEVCLTADTHQSGTDRLAEVLTKIDVQDDDIIVNVQGDEPLMPPEVIDQVANLIADNPQATMSTLSTAITDKEVLSNPNVVKVVANRKAEAIYFSRAAIPFKRDIQPESGFSSDVYLRHIGLYAYRVDFLRRFSQWPACELEKIESLEQLRVLWHGEKIHIAEAVILPPEGVDTMDDLEQVRAIIASAKDRK